MSENFLEGGPAKKPAEEKAPIQSIEDMEENVEQAKELSETEKNVQGTMNKEKGFIENLSGKAKKLAVVFLVLTSMAAVESMSAKKTEAFDRFAASVPSRVYIENYKNQKRALIDEEVRIKRAAEEEAGIADANRDILRGKYVICERPIEGSEYYRGYYRRTCDYINQEKNKAAQRSAEKGRLDATRDYLNNGR